MLYSYSHPPPPRLAFPRGFPRSGPHDMSESHDAGLAGFSLPGPEAFEPEPVSRVRGGLHRMLQGPSVQQHPALLAWNRLQATPAQLSTVEVWREFPGHHPASIYLLEFASGGPCPVFAKRCEAASGQVERFCYEQVVPRSALSSPAYFGSTAEPDGTSWLFLEDVGREKLSAGDPTHRALASRWIGRLHRFGAGIDAARQLPEAGPPRYLQHLRDARMRIGDHFGNPGLTASEREHLAETQALLDQVEARWDAIVRGCAGLPETVVHGDFRPKNVRIRTGAGGPTLYALDWELAGWGIPVVDLAPGRGAAGILQIDPGIYADELRGHGPSLDGEAIERLSLIGFMLRRLAAIDWESLSLHFEDPRYLSDPTASIQVARQELARGLARAESWLR